MWNSAIYILSRVFVRAFVLSKSLTSKNCHTAPLMHPRNPTRNVTHCTTGSKFWCPNTDRFYQRYLKSFLDFTEKRLFSRRLSQFNETNVYCVQNPAIHALRSNSVVTYRLTVGKNITRNCTPHSRPRRR